MVIHLYSLAKHTGYGDGVRGMGCILSDREEILVTSIISHQWMHTEVIRLLLLSSKTHGVRGTVDGAHRPMTTKSSLL